MTAISSAIYHRLAGDATLSGMLATYAGAAAVFTVDPVPDDARMPYVVIPPALATAPRDTKTTRGREVIHAIRCYTPATGSTKAVDAIAERVRALLHRQPLTVAGFGVYIADATGPSTGPEEKDAYGRIVTIRLTMQEN